MGILNFMYIYVYMFVLWEGDGASHIFEARTQVFIRVVF